MSDVRGDGLDIVPAAPGENGTRGRLRENSPVRCQVITWTNADLLSIGLLGTNFSEISIKSTKHFIHENAFENVFCEIESQANLT